MPQLPVSWEAFNAGEVTDLIDGQVSQSWYKRGADQIQNGIPLVQGPVVQRSGFYFAGLSRSQGSRTLVLRFEFGIEQAYLLEFGDSVMRVYRDDAVVTLSGVTVTGVTQANPGVVTAAGHGYSNGDKVLLASVGGMVELANREFTVANVTANTFELSGVNTTTYTAYTSGGQAQKIYEIATPYPAADLFDANGVPRLSLSQQADVAYLYHRSYATRKLTRSAHTSWAISTVTFKRGPFAPINSDDAVRVFCTAAAGYEPGATVSLFSNSDIFLSGHVGALFYLEEQYLADNDVSAYAVGTGVTAGGNYSYDGRVYELVATSGTTSEGGRAPPVHETGDAWTGIKGESGSNLYRFLHGRWAVLEITAYTSARQVTATIKTRLPSGLAPVAKTVTNATDNGSGLIRISCTGHQYSNDDYVRIASVGGVTAANGDWKISGVTTNTFDLVGSAFSGSYTSGGTVTRMATWKWAHGAFSSARGYAASGTFWGNRHVLASTTEQPDGFWVSESSNYEGFSPRTLGGKITAAEAFWDSIGSPQVNDIEWCIGAPDGILFGTAGGEFLLSEASTSDPLGPNNYRVRPQTGFGSLANFKAQQVGSSIMWAQRSGKKVRNRVYEGPALQSMGDEMMVRAEHLVASSGLAQMAWAPEPDNLLYALRQDGVLLLCVYDRQQEVFAWAPLALGGTSPFVESIAVIPRSGASQLWAAVRRTIGGNTVRTIEYLKPRYTAATGLSSAMMVDCGLTYSGSVVTSVSGLWHLNGETVNVAYDGKTTTATVSATGRVTLPESATSVHVGYFSPLRVKTKRAEPQAQIGNIQGWTKRFTRAVLRVKDANNIKCGSTFTEMQRVNFRLTSDAVSSAVPLRSGDYTVVPVGKWDNEGRLCIENDQPVPCTLVGIFATVDANPP